MNEQSKIYCKLTSAKGISIFCFILVQLQVLSILISQ